MRVLMLSVSALLLSTGLTYADDKPQPTDPLSSSRAPDPKPKTGNSTFDAPDKPAGPWGEIPGGGGPSGYNDGSGQTAPQYEGEKFKSAQQSERDTMEKPGGRPAPEIKKHGGQGAASSGTDAGKKDVAKGGEGLDADRQMGSPGHLGPQGGSTADSGKAKHDEQARAER